MTRRTGEEAMTYEEKLDAMAEAMWQAENVRMMGRPRLVEWSAAGEQPHMHWRASARAAAETIGLKEMMDAAACWDRLSDFRNHLAEQLIEQTAAHLKTNNLAK
jgi:hypothetical protein